MLMRRKSAKRIPEAFVEAGYLIERLFRIIEDLLEKVHTDPGQPSVKQGEIEKLKRLYYRHVGRRVGPTERDRYRPRKKLQRDCRRKTGFLKQVLGWIGWQQRCPDCHGTEVQRHCRRSRRYVDKAGQLMQGYSQVYRCLNPLCRTKYFTVPPKGVELYARVHRDVKKMVLRWIFHLRGSLSRVCDELAEHGITVSLTTVLRWVKKAGEECVQPLHLLNQEDWQQPLCIDEKWVKVRSKWHYVFTAVGTKVTDLLGIDLYFHKDRAAIKTFLLQLKSFGFRPQSITTDLLLGYEGVVREVFPECRYYQCMLHARRDANRIVRQNLPNKCDEQWKDRLIQSISTLFHSKRLRQAKKRYRRLVKLKSQAPEAVQPVFKMMEKYFPKFCQIVGHKEVPKTTNPVERAIGELEERYQLTKGFTSFYFAQFFIKAVQMYYRLRKLRFGPFRGRSRLQLKRNPIGQMDFTDYLTPTFV
jgi:transposase-like protein